MLALCAGHYGSKLGVSESNRHDLRGVLGPGRATHAFAQPCRVIASFGFVDPLVDLLLGNVVPLNLPLHEHNRNTNDCLEEGARRGNPAMSCWGTPMWDA